MSKSAAAFTHVQAYVYEGLENQYHDQSEFDDELYRVVHNCTNIKQLLNLSHPFYRLMNEIIKFDLKVNDFYKAMLKVIPHLRQADKEAGEDYRDHDHGGTECRGWYRVWGAMTQDSGYFCNGDFGRDVDMGMTFLEAGAVTQEQYNKWRVLNTLKAASTEHFMTDGFPDVKKMENYWKPEFVEYAYDCRLLFAMKLLSK